MNSLPRISFAARLNAFVAAVAVTLALASGIDSLASTQGAALPLAQAATTQGV